MLKPPVGHGVRMAMREEPDAHGQAALILAESILHALVDCGLLSADYAASVVQTACEVKSDVAAADGESFGRMHDSLALLARIAASFGADIE